MVDMRIIKNLLFLLIFIASTLQVPAFCKYAPEFGARIDLYGTVEQISAIPDPGRNDYPNCLYAVKVKVHSADRQLGDDTAIVVIPVLKNGKLLPENVLRVGDKAGKVVDTASLPPGRNDYLDLIFANPGSGFTLSFKNTNGRKLTEITRGEMFSW